MLIINADDYGRNRHATDRTIQCYDQGVITSASAMVFMADSRRAADLAVGEGLETGLHLNLTLPFDGPDMNYQIKERHLALASYLNCGKWAQVVYNPFLHHRLDDVYQAQVEEYHRLFNREPTQIDGHSHMHLCMNMIFGRVIPPGMKVRRSFTFARKEKSFFNRLYRRQIDNFLRTRYRCTHSFYSIEPVSDPGRVERIVHSANTSIVELMVHPANADQYEYLMSLRFRDLIRDVPKGTYRMLE